MEYTPSINPMDPRPMSSTPAAESYAAHEKPFAEPPIGLHLPQVTQIPDHPGSMLEVPRVGATLTPMAPDATVDIKSLRSNCQFGMREYLSLVRKRQRPDASTATMDLESRIRTQAVMVLNDLSALQSEVRSMVKKAENHRWRRWIVGGLLASFIPAVRHFFRRSDDEESKVAANDTEHAWRRSQGMLSYIKEAVLGKGGFASMAFFVFAVLYVFQNEVTLRVAKTVNKRIKRVMAKIERGDSEIREEDLEKLEGWRWRILLW